MDKMAKTYWNFLSILTTNFILDGNLLGNSPILRHFSIKVTPKDLPN